MNIEQNIVDGYIKNWIGGIKQELNFWDKWFETRGLQWPEEYLRRMDPAPLFTLDAFIDLALSAIINVLDVGSGPISPVGLRLHGREVRLVACDPLAREYKQLFLKHEIHPYVLPDFAYAEALVDLYRAESFELVHMSNALDHSLMPTVCILNMLAVVKVGGKVVLRHTENEAEHEEYRGFHQWNITEKNGMLFIFNMTESINVNEAIQRYCDIECRRVPGERDDILAVLTRTCKEPIFCENGFKNAFDSGLLAYLINA